MEPGAAMGVLAEDDGAVAGGGRAVGDDGPNHGRARDGGQEVGGGGPSWPVRNELVMGKLRRSDLYTIYFWIRLSFQR